MKNKSFSHTGQVKMVSTCTFSCIVSRTCEKMLGCIWISHWARVGQVWKNRKCDGEQEFLTLLYKQKTTTFYSPLQAWRQVSHTTSPVSRPRIPQRTPTGLLWYLITFARSRHDKKKGERKQCRCVLGPGTFTQVVPRDSAWAILTYAVSLHKNA